MEEEKALQEGQYDHPPPTYSYVTTSQSPTLSRGSYQRPPLRCDLVKPTHDAINPASDSIHRSIQAPRMARHNSLHYKRQLTSKVRQEWQEDRAAAAKFHQMAHQLRLESS